MPTMLLECETGIREQATENQGDKIASRLLAFSVHVLQLIPALQRDTIGRQDEAAVTSQSDIPNSCSLIPVSYSIRRDARSTSNAFHYFRTNP
jgi:hypothetical protein